MEQIGHYILGIGQTIVPFLIVLSVVIFVHEFGHFWVARRCGVKVLTFSIGFGRELLGWTDRHGTHWRVALVPLGGYVRMLGDADPASSRVDPNAEELSEDDKKVAFYSQALWKKTAIVAAGPLFNFMFAILVFATLYTSYGQPFVPPVIGNLVVAEKGAEPTPAQKAGLQIGDTIVSIDGRSIESFSDVMEIVRLHPDTPLDFVIKRGEKTINASITPKRTVQKGILGDGEVGLIGVIAPDLSMLRPAVIGDISPDSALAKAGVKQNDQIVSVAGKDISNVGMLADAIQAAKGATIDLRVQRGTEALNIAIPFIVAEKDKPVLDGYGFKWAAKDNPYIRQLGPVKALMQATVECKNQIANQLIAVGQMISGKRDTKDLGGVISIARVSGEVATNYGMISFVILIATISIAIGLFNLFPVPILDGGHLLFYAIEAIRGKPLGPRAMEYALRFGFALLVGLMIFATYNDLLKLIPTG